METDLGGDVNNGRTTTIALETGVFSSVEVEQAQRTLIEIKGQSGRLMSPPSASGNPPLPAVGLKPLRSPMRGVISVKDITEVCAHNISKCV